MALGRRHHSGAMAPTTLNGNISAGATSLVLAAATNAPSTPFGIKIDAGTASEEKIIVGSLSGTTASSLTRGADGSSAASHSSGAAVEHDFFADEADEANDHINTTSRYDHDTQYARRDGTVGGGGGSATFTGALSVATGGFTVSAGGASITGPIVGSSTVQGTAHISTLTGTNGRYVGSTSGTPSGTYSTGDFANDPGNECFWLCTSGGTPGTWVAIGGAHFSARVYLNTNATLTNGSIVPFDTVDYDPLSMYSASTHKFTVPQAGIYAVSSNVTSGTSTSQVALLNILKNGSTGYNGPPCANGSSGQFEAAAIATDVKCAANDTLQINWFGTTGAADGSSATCYATVRYTGPA